MQLSAPSRRQSADKKSASVFGSHTVADVVHRHEPCFGLEKFDASAGC